MTHSDTRCPACEEGTLSARTDSVAVRHHNGQVVVDDMEYGVCDQCGEELVSPTQARRNDARVADAKRKADGLLSGEEIAGLRRHLGLSQQQAARLFGGGPNAFSKYERGEVIQSVAMDRLLRIIASEPALLDRLQNIVNGNLLQRVEEMRSTSLTPIATNVRHLVDVNERVLGAVDVLEGVRPVFTVHQSAGEYRLAHESLAGAQTGIRERIDDSQDKKFIVCSWTR